MPKEHDLFSCTQHLETMSPLPKENAVDGQRTCEVVVSYPVFSNSTFCLPLSNEIIGKLFNGMRGKYFHEKTSLELLTYVLTGRVRSLRVPYPLNGLPLPGVSHCSLALYVLHITTNGKWANLSLPGV